MSAQTAVKTEASESYDAVPYESYAYPQTHPAHLSTVATLFGLAPPDFRTARVLEIGCAGGGNLFPMALAYPKARFLGIDISQAQIAQANLQKQALNLNNVEFQQQDILKFSPKEKFDYIVCHGVFSWVPENVRERVLGLCSEALSPDGIAVISYNTLPGWNAVRSLRDMMLYHASRFSEPKEKIRQARFLLDFLLENVAEGNKGYRGVIEDERNILKQVNDTYLYHDHLEGVNAQFYFHDFVRMASRHGLSYVGDTNIVTMYVGNMPQKAMEALKAIDNVVNQEQYMDFVNNRRFRSSILCKESQKVNRNLQSDQIMNYFLAAHAEMTADASEPRQTMTFKAMGSEIKTHHPISGALLLELIAARPTPVAATELVARVQKRLGLEDAAAVRSMLIEHGLHMVLKGFISLFSDVPHHVTKISQKPVAFPLARYQAGAQKRLAVTNVMHGLVTIDLPASLILQSLDGSRTASGIADVLVEHVRKGTLNVSKNGAPVTDADEIRRDMINVVEATLPKLAKQALLVG